MSVHGQARGYGRITNQRAHPEWWPLFTGLVSSKATRQTSLSWVKNDRSAMRITMFGIRERSETTFAQRGEGGQ